jgi:hypothetical protein
MKPAMKSSGVLKRARPTNIVIVHAKTWIVLGMTTTVVAAAKKTTVTVGIPTANMWWAQTPKPMKTTRSSAMATNGKATIRRCVKAGMISVAIPNAGTMRMYTSGWPKNQNRCCQSSVEPPRSASKKCVPTVRSRKRKIVSALSDGSAKRSPNDAASCA